LRSRQTVKGAQFLIKRGIRRVGFAADVKGNVPGN